MTSPSNTIPHINYIEPDFSELKDTDIEPYEDAFRASAYDLIVRHAVSIAHIPDGDVVSDSAWRYYLAGDRFPVDSEIAHYSSLAVEWALAVAVRDVLGEGRMAQDFLRNEAPMAQVDVMVEAAPFLEQELLSVHLFPVEFDVDMTDMPMVLTEQDEAAVILDAAGLMDLTTFNDDSELVNWIKIIGDRWVQVSGGAMLRGQDIYRAEAGEPVVLDRVHLMFRIEATDDLPAATVTTTQSYPMHTFRPLTDFRISDDPGLLISHTESGLVPLSAINESE